MYQMKKDRLTELFQAISGTKISSSLTKMRSDQLRALDAGGSL